jgi:hypothetical protein
MSPDTPATPHNKERQLPPRKSVPQKRREAFASISPEIEKIVKRHGLNDAMTAISRWLTVSRERRSIERQQARLERELAALKAKNARRA